MSSAPSRVVFGTRRLRLTSLVLLALHVSAKRTVQDDAPGGSATALSPDPGKEGALSSFSEQAGSHADSASGERQVVAHSDVRRKNNVLPFVDVYGEDDAGMNAFVGAGKPKGNSSYYGMARPGLKSDLVFGPEVPIAKQLVLALGGGTGALRGGTGDAALDRDIVRRMRYQDKAVLLMLLVVYITTLCVGASMTYRQSLNDSPVTYYADPRYHSTVTEDADLEGFLEAFAQVPKNAHLQVTGFVPMPDPIPGGVDWNGQHYHVAFTFSLDLSPWVVRLGNTDLLDGAERLEDGVVAEDRVRLAHFLANNGNDLATVEMQKEVTWSGWEELATNIKHQIRQRGFTNGVISVRQCEVEPTGVYKNKAWANFMHSRLTKVLCALSLVGWFVYLPYMWLRCSKLVVRSRYKIDLSIAQYWALISDQLCADGFNGNSLEQR